MLELLAIVVPVGLASIGGYMHMQIKTAAASQELVSLRELINERFDHLEQSQTSKDTEVDRRLDRIERSLNGHLLWE